MAKSSRPWYGRDFGLGFRMAVTMFLLFALYALFIVLLWRLRVPWPTLIVIMVIVALSQSFLSDQIVLWASGARILRSSEAPELHKIISRLAQLADLPTPKLAWVNSRMPNAFAIGRTPKSAVIAVTRGLMERLNAEEVEAVLAHELTHIKNRDVAVISIASFFAMVASFIVQQFFFIGFSMEDRDNRNGGGQAVIVVWLASLVVWAISYVLIRTLSRYREYAADRGSAILTGHPGYLASALEKIQSSMRTVPTRDLRQAESMNAFYIFPAIRKDSVMEIFSTHPTLEHRIRQLEKIQQQMEKK
ncbi:zinc metalloprotease HtpX [Sulfobacillus harzensis]|uniref:Protease HtpX homolog n=1 Tax=Sulfobacillus harzensis TaxID=2729629 RepID=A0A7Y0L5D0_9FIRM|nr:zinc metalloprotease HtpX [Sulfobacillus harzensis]NMP23618.1 zinc metalloprotease HtpX [Sulfobacillus harzensis]